MSNKHTGSSFDEFLKSEDIKVTGIKLPEFNVQKITFLGGVEAEFYLKSEVDEKLKQLIEKLINNELDKQ